MEDERVSLPDLPEDARDPAFREFYDHWRRAAPPGLLPGRQHLDPITHIPRLVPNLAIYDVVMTEEGQRFRIRLMGELMVDVIGTNPTGRFFDEFIKPAFRARLNAALSQVATDRIAHYWENQMWTYQNDFIRMRRLALPLASDGRNVDMIFACYVRTDEPAGGEDGPDEATSGGGAGRLR